MVRVKVCGLTCLEDVDAVVRSGANAVGFVLEPNSPRYVGDLDRLMSLLRRVPPFVSRVAVFGVLRDLPGDIWREVDVVQFLEPGESVSIPEWVRVVRAVRLRSADEVQQAMRLQEEADALLVDAYHPTRLGGTGATADWRLACLLRDLAEKPVILAGGLTPSNVIDAIVEVQPYAVDVSSGVESAPGKKDHLKVKEFIANVRRFADGS